MDALAVPCPPDDFEGRETEAFRWVFEDMEDERNFVPQYFKNPRYAQAEDSVRCQALGLSFFVSEEYARERFLYYYDKLGSRANHILGNHLAKGMLKPSDGVSNREDFGGHFTFHPFEKTRFEKTFAIFATL